MLPIGMGFVRLNRCNLRVSEKNSEERELSDPAHTSIGAITVPFTHPG
jgi:hypothetical protein